MNFIINKIALEQVSAIAQDQEQASFLEKGIILEVGDGVVRATGLHSVRAGEMVKMGATKMLGMAVTLEKNAVGIIIFGNDRDLRQGDWVISTGVVMSVPVSLNLAGRVIDPLGNSLENFSNAWMNEAEYCYIDNKAVGIIERQPVCEPLQTGILVVDNLIPIGCGQRELIIGDRQTGKTTIAVDAIINQTIENSGVWWVYVAVGQKRAGIVQIVRKLKNLNCMDRGVVVFSASDEPASLQYLAPYSGATFGEWLSKLGSHVLIIYDDLSKQAVAYRQMSLLLRRPPGREAFPGDVFYMHARLLERAAKLSIACGSGSLTAFPIVETQAGDVSAFIPTNVISITDGQIFLDTDLFNRGVRPGVNPDVSVSRVGSKAQLTGIKDLVGKLRAQLAQFKEVELLMNFGSSIDEETLALIERGLRLTELLKQPHTNTIPVKHQILFIFTGVFGYLDKLKVSDVSAFQAWLPQLVKTTNFFYTFNADDKLDETTFHKFSKYAIAKFLFNLK